MRQLLGCVLLLAAVVIAAPPPASAQKKGAKEGVITITEDAQGKFRFVVRDADDKTLAGLSAAYATAKDAEKGVATLKSVASKGKVAMLKKGAKSDKFPKEGVFEISESKDGKYRFSARDGDGKFLANSVPFATGKDAEKGVETFKKVVGTAKVVMGKKKDAKKKDEGK